MSYTSLRKLIFNYSVTLVSRKILCQDTFGEYWSLGAHVVPSLGNESTLLSVVEFQGKQCRRDSGAEYAARRAWISFLLRNNCERETSWLLRQSTQPRP